MSKRTKSNSIRIVAGQWRGRRLPVPDSPGLRPTAERVRETVFSWLMHDVAGSRCLDMFAGTGALGFESLSRGAEFVQFFESDKKAAKGIEDSIDLLQVNSLKPRYSETNSFCPRASLQVLDTLIALEQPTAYAYDVAFLDPPFAANLLEKSATLLEQNGWLSEHACIYLECDAKMPSPGLPSNWLLNKRGRAGQSAFYLYRRQPAF